MTGPLSGIRILEFGGLGPAPFAGMLLADFGAEVIRIDRPGTDLSKTPMTRSRKLLQLDLKSTKDVAVVRALTRTADGLIEGFRPGTMERLGLGPEILMKDNARLVYGRMTGWGQTGPNAPFAGHDINYIALTGALHAIGPAQHPLPPLALVGDMGGGGMFLAYSMTAALLHAAANGVGQVIDCAMVEGANLLTTVFHELSASGQWSNLRESNLLDGGAHFYGVYRTADDKLVSIGPLEPQFYALLLDKIGSAGLFDDFDQFDASSWPAQKEMLAAIFAGKTRAEWCTLLEMSDCCFAPVLDWNEAHHHPHMLSRGAFVDVGGVPQPAPAPRFSVTELDRARLSVTVKIEDLGVV